MKRFIFIMGAILALVLLPWRMPSQVRADTSTASDGVLIAPIAADPLPAGGSDFAVGGGTETFQSRTLHFAFSAHQNSPNPPTGYAVLTDVALPPFFTGGEDKIEGPMQCLAVAGNLADMVFTVKKTNSSDFTVGEQIVWEVVDNDTSSTPDMSGYEPSSLFSPVVVQDICSGQAVVAPAGTVTQGSVEVHDPVTAVLPCPSMTDNTTYMIDTNCNLYTMQNGTWTIMQ